MSDPRWQRLEELFHAAAPLRPDERAALLDRECTGDAALRAEVERLLSAADRAGGFIREPAVASPGVLPVDDAPQIGRRVGAFRLVRLLGKGGMGAVYLGERDDGAFSQRVAIKLIKRGMDTDQVLARFRAERQILASLDHPNVARLVDGGTTDDGLPFFAMEYIEGLPIDVYAEGKGFGVEERLQLFLKVCDAVSFAHAQGVIHRDLKPLNTLVTGAGVPKLLDFGIAKLLHDAPEESSTTVTGFRLLTPDYASPEQIEGRRATVASDVYSLGVVLYELLTKRSPYRTSSRSPLEIAEAVRTTDPARPSTVVMNRRLKGDLDTIVMTALRKEPSRRYPSVAAFADDIRRHLEGRPIGARGDGAGYRFGKFIRRNRTILTTASAAVVVAALATAAFARRSGGDPTLLDARSLELRDRILVADFADRAGDIVLSTAVTEAFRTDLAQSAVIRVMTPRQVRSSLERMEQSPDLALSDSLARELAVREGVKAIVTGSVARLSGAYTVSVQLVGTSTGEALASVRETAADSTGLIDAVDRASKALRERIGESLRDLEQMPRLDQATTASLPALRLYTEAQRLVRQGKRTDAIALFERAVALDSGFAGAHLGLSMAYGSIAADGQSRAASDRAAAHQDRLPFLERSVLLASRAYASQDFQTAIRVYSDLIKRYPDNLAAHNNLGLAYRDARRYPEAEASFRRALAIDSNVANMYFGIHSSQVLRGAFAEARITLDTLARRFPDHPVLLTEEMQDAAAQQDWARAERIAREHIQKIGTDTLQLVDPYEALGGMQMAQGRIAEAERTWRRHATLSRAAGVMGRHYVGVLQRGYLELRYRNDAARAVALVDSALRVTPIDSLLPGDRPCDALIRFYLAAGRRDRIAPLLAAARANDSVLGRTLEGERAWTLGMIALAEGRPDAAIEQLEAASRTLLCTNCAYPDLGRAFEAAGKPREAAGAYERYLTTPWPWRYDSDAFELGWTLQRLGALSLSLGDRERALVAYRKLEALWKGADRTMGPALDSLRQRVM